MWRRYAEWSCAGMDSIRRAEDSIRAVIAKSKVPEDAIHAENTLEWLLRLHRNAGEALCLAALGHDIERASKHNVRREDYSDYDAFKAAHARHSAEIVRSLLSKSGVPQSIRQEACRLVLLHEVGGDTQADLLKDADSLSYFEVNLPPYFEREGREETLRRCVWGLRRLSPTAKKHLTRISFPDKDIEGIVQTAMQSAAGVTRSNSGLGLP